MLQSFIGTFDVNGLRSLRSESEESIVDPVPANSVPFWAFLDSAELPAIHAAMMMGSRSAAFELLANRAKAFGRISS